MAEGWEFPPYTKTIHRTGYAAIDPRNPDNSAKGKVVVITGGGSGIGKGIAEAFAAAGARAVTILGRREDVLSQTKAELEAAGDTTILAFKAGIVDPNALDHAFQSTKKEVGPVDICIANAGFLPNTAKASELNVTDWWTAFEINIKGTLLTFQAFTKTKVNNLSVFIALNSPAAHLPAMPGFSGYSTSKLAQARLVEHLQAEQPDIRVISLFPGVIETNMAVKSELPLSRDDMSLPAGATVWLASPQADWLGGRFVWSHWDVHELTAMKEEILLNNELVLQLSGWLKPV